MKSCAPSSSIEHRRCEQVRSWVSKRRPGVRRTYETPPSPRSSAICAGPFSNRNRATLALTPLTPMPSLHGLIAKLAEPLVPRSRLCPEIPVRARHSNLSVVSSLDDDDACALDPELFRLALASIDAAAAASPLRFSVENRDTAFARVWPGEHYKLLAGLMHVLKPLKVVEIGTFTGVSASVIAQSLPPGGQLHTFDLLAWDSFSDTCLTGSDFQDNRIIQHLENLADAAVFERHRKLLESAQLIFLDGPKDGETEDDMWRHFLTLRPQGPCWVFMDDIRVWNMLRFWREVQKPKLDLTSFGHWSGSGLVRLHP